MPDVQDGTPADSGGNLPEARDILARALVRADEADGLHDQLTELANTRITLDNPDMDEVVDKLSALTRQQQSALDLASVLANIAGAVVAAREAKERAHPQLQLDFGDEDGGDGEYGMPRPLACLFTADLVGIWRETVGGRTMLFIPPEGWIDITGVPVVEDGVGISVYRLTGRAVSQYRDMVLVSADNGMGMTLPASLVTLRPDE